MGAAPSSCVAATEDGRGLAEDCRPVIENDSSTKRRSSSRTHSSGETVHCPTCQGTGRIPRGQESKLVAVIPCTDQRLKPRHTKLYVAGSVLVCLLISALVLFFLFPRSLLLSPVAVQSSYVFFTSEAININITNVLNITNSNFGGVQVYNLSVQAINYDTVLGSVLVKNVTYVNPLSVRTFSFVIPVKLTDSGLIDYCRKEALPVHILYLHLQMSMTVYYLAHYEQLSLDTYEYIDCGNNSTIPHSVLPAPP